MDKDLRDRLRPSPLPRLTGEAQVDYAAKWAYDAIDQIKRIAPNP